MRKLELPGRTKNMPRLEEHDIHLIHERGIKQIKEDTRKVVRDKLSHKEARKKVPRAGSPIYKAMHACRASSRQELSLAHGIPMEREMKEKQEESVVNLLTRWIAREYNFYRDEAPISQKKIKEF